MWRVEGRGGEGGERRVEGELEVILTNVIQVGKVLISIVYGML